MSVLRDVYIGEVSILERCLYWRDVCIREVCIRETSVLERFLYWRDVCIGEILSDQVLMYSASHLKCG